MLYPPFILPRFGVNRKKEDKIMGLNQSSDKTVRLNLSFAQTEYRPKRMVLISSGILSTECKY
jgi:hypothetical protein